MKLNILTNELRSLTGIHEQTDFQPINDQETTDSKSCLCANCPSYARGAMTTEPQELLYCQHGESNLEVKRNGCLCPSCSIYKANKYIGWYFCITGRAERASLPGEEGQPSGTEGEAPEGEAPEGEEPPGGEEEPPEGGEEGGEKKPPGKQQPGMKQAMGGQAT
jgi:hypothetical protein